MNFTLDQELLNHFTKLSVAALCGLLIGLERGYRGKAAGVRTNLLICLGAALFMVVSEKIAYTAKADGFAGPDPARIAAQVVTGIGFLGAGAILRNGGTIVGLTTAASIWCVSAIGLAAGIGLFQLSFLCTFGIIFTLEFFAIFEKRLRVRRFRYVKLEVVLKKEARVQDVRKVLRGNQITFTDESTHKILGEMHYTTLLYFRGPVERKLEEEISALNGVRDVIMLTQAVE